MRIDNYKDLVETLRSNALLMSLAEGDYYGEDHAKLHQEAENFCLEFVLELPGVRRLLEAEYDMTGDDQMLILWLRDAVFLEGGQ